MRNLILSFALFPVLLLSTGCADEASATSSSLTTAYLAAGGQNLIVELRGTATGETRTIDGEEMACFDLEVFDVASGKRMGTGTDCLDFDTVIGAGDGFMIENTTFFKLHGGSIKSKNQTTIQPYIGGSSPGLTHSTSDVPTVKNILSGTGQFREVKGFARLAGAVDLTNAEAGVITFNCIFVLSFD